VFLKLFISQVRMDLTYKAKEDTMSNSRVTRLNALKINKVVVLTLVNILTFCILCELSVGQDAKRVIEIERFLSFDIVTEPEYISEKTGLPIEEMGGESVPDWGGNATSFRIAPLIRNIGLKLSYASGAELNNLEVAAHTAEGSLICLTGNFQRYDIEISYLLDMESEELTRKGTDGRDIWFKKRTLTAYYLDYEIPYLAMNFGYFDGHARTYTGWLGIDERQLNSYDISYVYGSLGLFVDMSSGYPPLGGIVSKLGISAGYFDGNCLGYRLTGEIGYAQDVLGQLSVNLLVSGGNLRHSKQFFNVTSVGIDLKWTLLL